VKRTRSTLPHASTSFTEQLALADGAMANRIGPASPRGLPSSVQFVARMALTAAVTAATTAMLHLVGHHMPSNTNTNLTKCGHHSMTDGAFWVVMRGVQTSAACTTATEVVCIWQECESPWRGDNRWRAC